MRETIRWGLDLAYEVSFFTTPTNYHLLYTTANTTEPPLTNTH